MIVAIIIITITDINITNLLKTKEIVTFVDLTVDTTTGFVFAKEVFVPGICSYKAHPCCKSTAFFISPLVHCIICFSCLI